MPDIVVGKENSADIKIHHEDHGSGDNAALLEFVAVEDEVTAGGRA
jgi:hypothetical protein